MTAKEFNRRNKQKRMPNDFLDDPAQDRRDFARWILMSAEDRAVSEEAQRQQILNMAATQPSPFPTYWNNHGAPPTPAKPEPKPRKDEAVSGAAGRKFQFEP